jgi:hypothetical protein
MNAKQVRRLAIALPEVSEHPHFNRVAFKVKKKIFATLAADGKDLNVFVEDVQCEVMTAVDSKAYETRYWGKTPYLHVHLAAAKARDVEVLLESAWERMAPTKLREQHE